MTSCLHGFAKGRGGTVVLADLDAALRAGKLGGAGLDVMGMGELDTEATRQKRPKKAQKSRLLVAD